MLGNLLLSVLGHFKFSSTIPLSSKYYHKRLPEDIQKCIKLIQKESVLNEKCHLLEHLVTVLKADTKLSLSPKQQSQIQQELNKWKGGSGRFQNVATVAWAIDQLDLYKSHGDLYKEIQNRLLNDEWYVNFSESIKALEAFKGIDECKEKVEVMKKIERNISLTIWNVNMKYYQRIANALLQAGRFDSFLWGHMETQILENLEMEYDTRTICDIFKAYALTKNGHDVFYQMMEKALFQGHFRNVNLLNYRNFAKKYDSSGEFFSLVVETYSIAHKSCGVILTPEFKDFVYEALIDPKTEFRQLKSITKVVKNIEGLQLSREDVKQIEDSLFEKKILSFTLEDVCEFYSEMTFRKSHIPASMHQQLEHLALKEIKGKFIQAVKVVDFVNFLLQNDFLINRENFLTETNLFLSENFKYLYYREAQYIKQATSSNPHLLPSLKKESTSIGSISGEKIL